jgi:hypothetical protein
VGGAGGWVTGGVVTVGFDTGDRVRAGEGGDVTAGAAAAPAAAAGTAAGRDDGRRVVAAEVSVVGTGAAAAATTTGLVLGVTRVLGFTRTTFALAGGASDTRS